MIRNLQSFETHTSQSTENWRGYALNQDVYHHLSTSSIAPPPHIYTHNLQYLYLLWRRADTQDISLFISSQWKFDPHQHIWYQILKLFLLEKPNTWAQTERAGQRIVLGTHLYLSVATSQQQLSRYGVNNMIGWKW